MPKLLIHRDAAADLQAIRAAGDVRSWGVILAFLELAKGDLQTLESLSIDFYGVDGVGNYDIRKWVQQQGQGRDLWRVKLCDIKGLQVPYRILYACDPASLQYYVLAIMQRGIDYDESHERIRRLLDVYDALGLHHATRRDA